MFCIYQFTCKVSKLKSNLRHSILVATHTTVRAKNVLEGMATQLQLRLERLRMRVTDLVYYSGTTRLNGMLPYY